MAKSAKPAPHIAAAAARFVAGAPDDLPAVAAAVAVLDRPAGAAQG